MVRPTRPEISGKTHHHRLGDDQPMRLLQVLAHAGGIHGNAFGDAAGVRQRTVRQHEGLRKASASACQAPEARS